MTRFLENFKINMEMADGYKRKNDNLETCLIEIFLRSRGWYTYYSENYWAHKDMVDFGMDETTRGTDIINAFIYEVCELKNKTTTINQIKYAANIESLFKEKALLLLKRNTTKKENL